MGKNGSRPATPALLMPKAAVAWARRGGEGMEERAEMMRAPSFGRAGSTFSRASKVSVESNALSTATVHRPNITAGMLQMLAGGHCGDERSRYRQRPSSAASTRQHSACEDIARLGSSFGRPSSAGLPPWIASGPPSSPAVSPPAKETLKSPDGKTKHNASFRALPLPKTSADDVKLDFLHSLPLLAHMHREKLAPLLSHMSSSHEKFGTLLQVEDQPTDNIVIIWNGTVTVERKVIDATTCEEVRILSSCMRKAVRNKAVRNASAGEEGDAEQTKSAASLVIGKCGRGAVFGDYAAMFEILPNETVRVDSVGGSHVIRILAASLREICDEKEIASMKAKARDIGRWREGLAADVSGSMTTAAYHYSARIEAHVAFPTTEELRAINAKAVEDLWHPLGWRKKLALKEERERRAADIALSDSIRAANKSKKSSTASRRRPASALGTSRRQKPVQEVAVLGAANIHDRNLYLTTWVMPQQHHVHLGDSGARGDVAAARGFRVELDIDAVKDLDGTYLTNFQ